MPMLIPGQFEKSPEIKGKYFDMTFGLGAYSSGHANNENENI